MPVMIKIRYYGRYADRAGLAEEQLDVDPDVGNACQAVAGHLARKYGIEPPYNLLINDKHMIGAMKAGLRLKDGDVFHVLPFMSGG